MLAANLSNLAWISAEGRERKKLVFVRQGIDIPTVAKAGNFSPEVLLRRYAHGKQVQELPERVFGTKSAHKRTKKTLKSLKYQYHKSKHRNLEV
jgi:hypothetical protein